MKTQILGKEVEIKTEAVVIIVAILALLGCLAGYIFFNDNSSIIIEAGDGGSAPDAALNGAGQQADRDGGTGADAGKRTSDQAAPGPDAATRISGAGSEKENPGNTGIPENKDMIKIYVVGCVNKPGIVEIEKGGMINDAVSMAGGLTEEADASNINMVYTLNENVMLHIQSKKESEQRKEATGSNTTRTGSVGRSAVISAESGESALVIGEGDDNTDQNELKESKPKLVNINTADAAELDTLPGVGEATARDIITFRENNGGFEEIEDIMKVPRIKQNRFESIRDFITVE